VFGFFLPPLSAHFFFFRGPGGCSRAEPFSLFFPGLGLARKDTQVGLGAENTIFFPSPPFFPFSESAPKRTFLSPSPPSYLWEKDPHASAGPSGAPFFLFFTMSLDNPLVSELMGRGQPGVRFPPPLSPLSEPATRVAVGRLLTDGGAGLGSVFFSSLPLSTGGVLSRTCSRELSFPFLFFSPRTPNPAGEARRGSPSGSPAGPPNPFAGFLGFTVSKQNQGERGLGPPLRDDCLFFSPRVECTCGGQGSSVLPASSLLFFPPRKRLPTGAPDTAELLAPLRAAFFFPS